MLESCGKVVLPSIKKNEDQPETAIPVSSLMDTYQCCIMLLSVTPDIWDTYQFVKLIKVNFKQSRNDKGR